jgi:hypothetical protein
MAMRNRLRLSVAPVLAVVAVAVGLLTVAAPAANAAPIRQVYGHQYFGAPSVTVPQCNADGQAFVNAGRFDFYRCVAIDSQTEELEGFLITG